HVLKESIQHRPPPSIAISFLGLLHPTKFASRGVPRLIGRHPFAHVLLRQHLQVGAQFFVHFFVEPVFFEQAGKPRCQNSNATHVSSLVTCHSSLLLMPQRHHGIDFRR